MSRRTKAGPGTILRPKTKLPNTHILTSCQEQTGHCFFSVLAITPLRNAQKYAEKQSYFFTIAFLRVWRFSAIVIHRKFQYPNT